MLNYITLDIFDHTITQFIAILFGDLLFVKSLGNAKFIDLNLPQEVYDWFWGPKFGTDEIKKRFEVEEYPMLVAIIKPSLGRELSIDRVKKSIENVLEGGFHAIKDDEAQGDLSYTPLDERVKLVWEYKRYIPTLNLDNLEQYKK